MVAIDGSVYSNQALSYIPTFFKDQEDVHFHLCSMVTAGTSVMPSVANSKNSLMPDAGGDAQAKKASAKQYLHKTSEKLGQAGIAPERIKTSIQISGYNIAGTPFNTPQPKIWRVLFWLADEV